MSFTSTIVVYQQVLFLVFRCAFDFWSVHTPNRQVYFATLHFLSVRHLLVPQIQPVLTTKSDFFHEVTYLADVDFCFPSLIANSNP